MHHAAGKVERLPELATRAGRARKAGSVKTVLALDLALTTGYAVRKESGRVESGSFDCRGKARDLPGARWANFRRFLVELKQANPDISVIWYEVVIGHGPNQVASAHCFGALRALVELFAFHHQIELKPVGVSAWKKRFTGNGAAKKDDVIAVCRQLGFKPADDNEADALGILHVALDACPVLAPSPAPKRAAKARKTAPVPAADGNPF